MVYKLLLTFALAFASSGLAAQESDQIGDLVRAERYTEAFDLASTQAEGGDALAHDWLGWLHEKGWGTPLDHGAAEQHYRIAASQGQNHARWRLGVMIDSGQASGSLEDAVALFRRASDENYASGIVSLAVMQALGRGTPKDSSAAYASYLRAARLGDSGGIRGVGLMHYLGESVSVNKQEAAAWTLLAAEAGNEDAQALLDQLVAEIPGLDSEALYDRARAILDSLGLSQDP